MCHCCFSGSMVWWLNAGRKDQHAAHASRISTPACEPGRECHLMPAPAHPLVVEATPPPRPPRSAPALSATSATLAMLLLPQLLGTSILPRLSPPQAKWVPFQRGPPWLCPKPTNASSPSMDTPSRRDTQLSLPTSHHQSHPRESSSTTSLLLKAAPPAAPAAPPARGTSAVFLQPQVPTMMPTHRCSHTASCRGAVRCMDKFPRKQWDRWTTHPKHQRCLMLILTLWCTTTQSSLQTCRHKQERSYFLLQTQKEKSSFSSRDSVWLYGFALMEMWQKLATHTHECATNTAAATLLNTQLCDFLLPYCLKQVFLLPWFENVVLLS